MKHPTYLCTKCGYPIEKPEWGIVLFWRRKNKVSPPGAFFLVHKRLCDKKEQPGWPQESMELTELLQIVTPSWLMGKKQYVPGSNLEEVATPETT